MYMNTNDELTTKDLAAFDSNIISFVPFTLIANANLSFSSKRTVAAAWKIIWQFSMSFRRSDSDIPRPGKLQSPSIGTILWRNFSSLSCCLSFEKTYCRLWNCDTNTQWVRVMRAHAGAKAKKKPNKNEHWTKRSEPRDKLAFHKFLIFLIF